MPLESGLPLGLASASTYPEAVFQQKENEQIALVTDDVVEARATSGELFGFERMAAIADLPAEKLAQF